jgi:hypothetical protein
MFVFLSPRTKAVQAAFLSYIDAVAYGEKHPRDERVDMPDLAREMDKLVGPPIGQPPTLPAARA